MSNSEEILSGEDSSSTKQEDNGSHSSSIDSKRKNNPIYGKIGRRIILIMILLSSAITLLTTIVQLYWDYEQQFNSVEQRHHEIKTIHANLLASSLWNFDLILLQERLDGLVHLPSIDYLQVNSGQYEFKAGKAVKSEYISDTYPLMHYNADTDKFEEIGTLYVETNTREIYNYLINQFLVTLALNAFKTALVCYLILIVFHKSINQRIFAIAKYLGRYDPERPAKPLVLEHKKFITEKNDELYWLGDETNKITANVTRLYRNIKFEQERLSDFTHVSSDWLWETDEFGHLIYCSEIMQQALDIDTAKKPLVNEISLLASADNLANALAHQSDFSRCEETIEINGITRHFMFQGLAKHLKDKFMGYRGTTIDITELKVTQLQLEKLNTGLERTVAERTLDLKQSMEKLQAAQNQLIESEKLAALGGLVAGVAHEVNTPLGISVTATSVVKDSVKELNQAFEAQTLTSAQFAELMSSLNEGVTMLEHNLSRAAKLVRDFKQTAVDQVSESRSEFNIKQVLDALIASLHPETRTVPVTPIVEGDGAIIMNSLPGVLTQIVSNLVLNSVIHAFSEQSEPQISIHFSQQGEDIIFDYRDNGSGVEQSLHQKIFEPFFTSRRGRGGSGLGLNLVFNLVKQKLQGHLKFESEPGKGVHFHISIPRELNMIIADPSTDGSE
ncbi:ATP-binding protein [Vibrio sp. S4M6]|uniref:sensor histidine kinase n=1 Tax=Vibrio sinus TaxID=2946865 RepID=UPI00202A0E87|nr:ATP-binding protein [Vibrio sinus]MCL9783175.1 ATP-binding protein [Vibrio sinus]